ncbi:MAG: VWA domain-containing protein [Chloroflexales bacterium]
MDSHSDQLTPEQLYDQALAFFRAARWEEATQTLQQLQAQSNAYPEAEALLDDIQLKRGLERVQSPIAAAPPREPFNRGREVTFVVIVLAVLGLSGGSWWLWSLLSAPTVGAPVASQQAAVGSLPTAAPNALTPTTDVIASGIGVLTVMRVENTTVADNIYFILDASGSMLAKINDQRKIDMAHQALGAIVKDLNDSTKVALRTYGRNRTNDCSDIELVRPLGPLNRDALLAQINSIVPVNRSNTPIGSSLAALSADLVGVKGQTLVVLLSDGEESCNGDPVAEATRLHTDNPNIRVSVVGFDIAPEFQTRLAAIADAGGGTYFGAADVNQLATALRQTIALNYRVYDSKGREIGHSSAGESLKLAAGSYRVVIGGDPPLLEQTVDIRKGVATLMALSIDKGKLSAKLSHDWAR